MTSAAAALRPSQPLTKAGRAMRDQGVGSVLVVDNGQLKGLVTDRDIVVRAVADGRDPGKTTIAEVCSRNLVTAAPDDDADTAVRRMREHGVRGSPSCRTAAQSGCCRWATWPSSATSGRRSRTSAPRRRTPERLAGQPPAPELCRTPSRAGVRHRHGPSAPRLRERARSVARDPPANRAERAGLRFASAGLGSRASGGIARPGSAVGRRARPVPEVSTSLEPGERHALAEIESGLRRSDPELAAMLGLLTVRYTRLRSALMFMRLHGKLVKSSSSGLSYR